MKKVTVKILRYCYTTIKSSELLRTLIKKCIGNDKIKVRFNGFLIHVGTKSALESDVIFDNYSEKLILKLIETYTKQQYHFIDIGANIGLHSLTAAKSNSDIEIYSFEPEPNNFQNLIANILANNFCNIRPFKIGIGDTIENKHLNLYDGWNQGKHSLKKSFNGNKSITIPITTLDSFKNNIDSEKLIIKIDVEGYEKEAVLGAVSILKKAPNCVVIIELIEQNNSSTSCQEIIEILKENKFETLYKIEDNQLIEVTKFNQSSDYVFIKGADSETILQENKKYFM